MVEKYFHILILFSDEAWFHHLKCYVNSQNYIWKKKKRLFHKVPLLGGKVCVRCAITGKRTAPIGTVCESELTLIFSRVDQDRMKLRILPTEFRHRSHGERFPTRNESYVPGLSHLFDPPTSFPCDFYLWSYCKKKRKDKTTHLPRLWLQCKRTGLPPRRPGLDPRSGLG